MDVTFPRILPPSAAQVMVTQQQLARFERLPAAQQDRVARRQLAKLMEHAAAASSFWRARLRGFGADAPLAALPVLTRADVQAHAAEMRARTPEMTDATIQT